MPEGDTVFLLARRLDRSLRGRRLARGELRVPAHATADLAGRTVLEHDTYGKHLLTRFDDGLTLHTHLRMDGSWTVVNPGKRLPGKLMPDVRVVLACENGPTAYGLSLPVVELLRTEDENDAVGYLGPDPLRPDWDAAAAVANLGADPTRPLAAALLDQRNLAGLGNLWANEISFLRGYSPWTPVGDVDIPATVALAARALRHSARTPGALQITTGNRRRGSEHWVSGRAGQPCRRCGTPHPGPGRGVGRPRATPHLVVPALPTRSNSWMSHAMTSSSRAALAPNDDSEVTSLGQVLEAVEDQQRAQPREPHWPVAATGRPAPAEQQVDPVSLFVISLGGHHMIKQLHEVGVRSEHVYLGGFASIALSFVSYFVSRKVKGDDKAQADRWVSSSATGRQLSSPWVSPSGSRRNSPAQPGGDWGGCPPPRRCRGGRWQRRHLVGGPVAP